MSEEAAVVETQDPDEVFVQKEFESGKLGYYHAHTKPREDLSSAKIITGPGLATMEGCEKLSPTDERYEERHPDKMEKIEKIEKHLFSDETKKVKVYLDVTPEMMKEGTVDVEFEPHNLWVLITTPTRKLSFVVADQPLNAEIIPEQSSWRVNSSQTKIAITLKKKVDEFWPQLVKKEMNQHTGWN